MDYGRLRVMFLGILLSGVGLSGCVATPLPPMDRRVTVAEDLGMGLYITDVRCVKGSSSYYTFQANAVNNTSGDLGVEWKVTWLDANGVALEAQVPAWNKVVIPAKDIQALKCTATRLDAVDMLFHVRGLRQ